MAIKPVEYVKDSSTSGFAVAGDQKTITKENANTIRKDADQGNTKDLDNAQEKYLDGKVDYDNLDYSTEEMGKVGEQQIDTEGEDGEDLSEKDQKAGSNAAVAISATGAAVAATSVIAVTILGKAADGFTGGVAAIAAQALAATSLGLSFPGAYDPNIDERKNQTGAAADNNAIIQQYIDNLNADMDMMNEDVNTYTELSAMQTEAQVETITDLGAMQAELQVYQAQGNTAKVAEIRGKMTDLQTSSEEILKEPQEQMDGLKENIETYTGNNAEAAGVKASGDTVSDFLLAGKPMANKAKAIQILQYVAAAACMSTIVIPKFLFDIAPAAIATVQFVAAGLVFGVAANMMGKNADTESAAADAGSEMAGNLANLQANIDGQAGFTEATSGSYGETDEAATETVEENQEATDKANGKGRSRGKTEKRNGDQEEGNNTVTNSASRAAA